MKTDMYIQCPHCSYKYEDIQEYINPEDMNGKFEMPCVKCRKSFIVEFSTIITFKTSKSIDF